MGVPPRSPSLIVRRDAEVDQDRKHLVLVRAAQAGQEDVVGLDVLMADPGGVQGGQRARQRLEDPPRLRALQRAPPHPLLEGLALVPGHHEPEALFEPAVILELHQRGVEDGRVQPQLAQGRLARALAERGRAQELERHAVAGDLGVIRPIDVAERADAHPLHDGVATADDGPALERLLVDRRRIVRAGLVPAGLQRERLDVDRRARGQRIRRVNVQDAPRPRFGGVERQLHLVRRQLHHTRNLGHGELARVPELEQLGLVAGQLGPQPIESLPRELPPRRARAGPARARNPASPSRSRRWSAPCGRGAPWGPAVPAAPRAGARRACAGAIRTRSARAEHLRWRGRGTARALRPTGRPAAGAGGRARSDRCPESARGRRVRSRVGRWTTKPWRTSSLPLPT